MHRRETTIIGVLALLIALIFFIWSQPKKKNCFVAIENGEIVRQEGDCLRQVSPYCTFNYVLSLVGYDLGILEDENFPIWEYKEGYSSDFDSWKRSHTPKSWRKYSCMWYSELLLKKIQEKQPIQAYLDMMTYGNRDISGGTNEEEQFWLGSTLKISPYEQAWFVHKLLNREFPLSDHAYRMTNKIFYNRKLDNGWLLYGKKGRGWQIDHVRHKRRGPEQGWFLGWLQKGKRQIVFASFCEEEGQNYSGYISSKARQRALKELEEIIKQEPANKH